MDEVCGGAYTVPGWNHPEADRMTVGANVRDPKVLALSLLAPCRLVLQLLEASAATQPMT